MVTGNYLDSKKRKIFKSKQSSVFGCSVNWPDWNVTI